MAARTFTVFVTGGTGYLGTPLIRALVKRGHSVRALVRPGSEKKLPPEAKQSPATRWILPPTRRGFSLRTPLCSWSESLIPAWRKQRSFMPLTGRPR